MKFATIFKKRSVREAQFDVHVGHITTVAYTTAIVRWQYTKNNRRQMSGVVLCLGLCCVSPSVTVTQPKCYLYLENNHAEEFISRNHNSADTPRMQSFCFTVLVGSRILILRNNQVITAKSIMNNIIFVRKRRM